MPSPLIDDGIQFAVKGVENIWMKQNIHTHLNYNDTEKEMQKVVEATSKKSITYHKTCVS